MDELLVSVVMGVHNGAQQLPRTLDSVLSQTGVDLEFIVVDDGSVDATAEILRVYADRDSRLRILSFAQNRGLTEALIAGCRAARGRYLARQDAGDVSLPCRFAEQSAWLELHPRAVLVSCHTRLIGLYGEPLFDVRIPESELSLTLARGADGYRGPSHHGSVMMRASAYHRVGGYRQPFVVAQDLDLWLRLSEVGDVGVVDRIGYESVVSPTGISAQRNALQARLAALAGELASLRRGGGDESGVLAAFNPPVAGGLASDGALMRRYRYAAYTYFLGRCITENNPSWARRYFLAGLAHCPWHLRSWYGLAASAFYRNRGNG